MRWDRFALALHLTHALQRSGVSAKLLELAERRATQHSLEQQLISYREHARAEPQNAATYAAQAEAAERSLRTRAFM